MPNDIDPLDYEERLTQAGVPAEQAHVHAETIGQVKAELEALEERAKPTPLEEKVGQGFARIDKELVALNNKIDSGLVSLNTKIDSGLAALDTKIDSGLAALDIKIDTGLAAMNTKIDTGLAELNTKIDRTKLELEAKIDRNRAELEARIEKVKWQTIRWTIGIVIAVCSLQGVIIVNVLR